MESKYQKLRTLGEGSFGKCMLVKEKATNKQYACKIIQTSSLSSESYEAVFKEVKILEKLSHPHIIGFVEVYRSRTQLNIIMEYADGGDLSSYLTNCRGRPIPEAEVLRLLGQIAMAVQYLHRKNIIHRDLKPLNVFITKANDVKLGDFGASKVLQSERDRARTYIGTPYYLSPEIINGEPYSFPTDIWSLGVLIYELCAKRPPFDARSVPSLLKVIQTRSLPPLPPGYSPALFALLSQMMEKAPLKRPTISVILKHPLVVANLKMQMNVTIEKNRQLKTDTIRKIDKGQIPQRKQEPAINLRLKLADAMVAKQAPRNPPPVPEEIPRIMEDSPAARIFGVDPEPMPQELVSQDFAQRPQERKAVLLEVKGRKKAVKAYPAPIAPRNEEEEIEKDYKENVRKILEVQKVLVEEPEDVVVKPIKRPQVPAEGVDVYEDISDIPILMEAKYQKVKIIGEGPHAKCIQVKEKATNKQYACKIIQISALSSEFSDKAFKEVKILEKLSHPHIIGFVEVYRSRTQLNIIMEYADGGNLLAYLTKYNDRPIPEAEVLRLLGQIAMAVHYLHRKNIIHRDLKPQNVLINKENDAKLGDFQTSKVLQSERDQARTYIGTPYYLSPEIINEEPYSFPTDIWSLGVLIYELCAKRPPFDASNLPSLLKVIQTRSLPPLPPGYSPALFALLSQMMHKAPSKRPTISVILKHPLVVANLKMQMNVTIEKNRQLKTDTIRKIDKGQIPQRKQEPAIHLRLKVADAKVAKQAPRNPPPVPEEIPRIMEDSPAARIFGVDPEPMPQELVSQDFAQRPQERKAVLLEVKGRKKAAKAYPAPIAPRNEEEEIEKDYKENVRKILEVQKVLVEEPEDVVVKPIKRPQVPAEGVDVYEDISDMQIPEEPLSSPLQAMEIQSPLGHSSASMIRRNLIKLLSEPSFHQVYNIMKKLLNDPRFRDFGTGSYKAHLDSVLSLHKQILAVPQFKVLFDLEDKDEKQNLALGGKRK